MACIVQWHAGHNYGYIWSIQKQLELHANHNLTLYLPFSLLLRRAGLMVRFFRGFSSNLGPVALRGVDIVSYWILIKTTCTKLSLFYYWWKHITAPVVSNQLNLDRKWNSWLKEEMIIFVYTGRKLAMKIKFAYMHTMTLIDCSFSTSCYNLQYTMVATPYK